LTVVSAAAVEVMIIVAIFAAGVATAAAAVIYPAAKSVLNSGGRRDLKVPQFPVSAGNLSADGLKSVLSGVNGAYAAGGLTGAFLAALLTRANLQWTTMGGCLGSLVGWLIYNNIRETRRMRKIREVAALYEAVDFFTAAGYTIPQAMRLGMVTAPTLRSCVEKCLARYSRDRVHALEGFARDVDLPEAALLAAVLSHAEEAGVDASRSALQEESRALEELRKSLAQIRVISKPLYFAVYRGLPFAAIGGVVVGPLAYRLIKTIQMITNLN